MFRPIKILLYNNVQIFNDKLRKSTSSTFLQVIEEMSKANVEPNKETLDIIFKITNQGTSGCSAKVVASKTKKLPKETLQEYLSNKKL